MSKVHDKTYAHVEEILVRLWNDIVNRQAGKIVFGEHMDILAAHTAIMHIIESTAQTNLDKSSDEQPNKLSEGESWMNKEYACNTHSYKGCDPCGICTIQEMMG